MELNGILSQLL